MDAAVEGVAAVDDEGNALSALVVHLHANREARRRNWKREAVERERSERERAAAVTKEAAAKKKKKKKGRQYV